MYGRLLSNPPLKPYPLSTLDIDPRTMRKWSVTDGAADACGKSLLRRVAP